VLTRTLLQLRRTYLALTQGGYQTLDQENSTCFVYLRQHEQQRLLVALNFSNQAQEVKLPDAVQGRVILSTNLDREEIMQTPVLHLRANEGVLIQL
jgi:glycosidase